MLTGLIFATDDADDRPDLLAATLAFGGSTLIEFQARLLMAAGAGHLLIVVQRLTPELLGAINRITRRGVTVDAIRSAREAEAKLHPLSRVLVMADGLVTTDAILSLMTHAEGDALLVTNDAMALPGLERVGADAIWAGVAMISMAQIVDVAAMPREYDFASTLLRVTAQGGARHIALPANAVASGHGVEHDSRRLGDRNDALVAAHVSGRSAWVDRFVQAPIARRILPMLVSRGINPVSVATAAGGVMIAGLGLVAVRWTGLGMSLVVLANLGLMIGSILSWMRDQEDQARFQSLGIAAGSALAVVLAGRGIGAADGSATALVLAGSVVVLAGLLERGAGNVARPGWWGSPAAYPLLLLPFLWAGLGLYGLAAMAVYAAASLGGLIEFLRPKAAGPLP
ncbi:MAG: hypothetical protein K2P68_12230 [Sphingomonas sp.]|nr:hypothetical protein [Sphingomonas sp.]